MDLTNKQIEDRLLELGTELSGISGKFKVASVEFLEAQAQYENDLDKAYLSIKAKNESFTVKEVESTSRNETFKKRLFLIEKRAVYEGLKNDLDVIRQKVSILQSVIKLRTEEMRNL